MSLIELYDMVADGSLLIQEVTFVLYSVLII